MKLWQSNRRWETGEKSDGQGRNENGRIRVTRRTSAAVITANRSASSLTSPPTCVPSHSLWLLRVMLCFIWRAIIFPIKYTTCISLCCFGFFLLFSVPFLCLNEISIRGHYTPPDRESLEKQQGPIEKENNAPSTEMETTGKLSIVPSRWCMC